MAKQSKQELEKKIQELEKQLKSGSGKINIVFPDFKDFTAVHEVKHGSFISKRLAYGIATTEGKPSHVSFSILSNKKGVVLTMKIDEAIVALEKIAKALG